MTEDERLIAAMTEELHDCEAPITVVLRPFSAFQLLGLLQLALRHPGVEDQVARTARTFIAHVRAYFVDQNATAVLDVIRRGEDPREDR